MKYTIFDDRFKELVNLQTVAEKIAGGFEFTEGPIWHPLHQYLLFSDMPGDVRRRWDENNGVIEVKRPANKCNGMTYDQQLNLIICEHVTSSIIRETTDGRREVLASHFEGKELNSPNDVCVHSSGAIFFSDPWYGRMPVFGVERPRQLDFQGVYRIAPQSQEIELVVPRDRYTQPNGLCFSPDESLLYINDTEQALIRVYDVNPQGHLSNERLFASGIQTDDAAGAPDGMKCDAQGNVWVTGPLGLWVYAPDGVLLGKIGIPEMVGNIAWGGHGFDQLYIAASHSIYRLKTRIKGRCEPFMKAYANALPVSVSGGQLSLAPERCALIIQDLQNDVISEGGAFVNEIALAHTQKQKVVEHVSALANRARECGIPVIHVWFVTEKNGHGLTENAPIFSNIKTGKGVIRGTWGAQPAPGLEPLDGDYIVEKMRMSPWEGSRLETILKATRRDVLINVGAWTNMSVEHTARTAADKGYYVVIAEDGCSSVNEQWHQASIDIALPNVATVVKTEEILNVLG